MSLLTTTSIDEWADVCSKIFLPLRALGNDGFRGAINTVNVSDISISRVDCTPSSVARTPRLIASDPRDHVLLNMQLLGTATITEDGRQYRVDLGAAKLCEADRPYRLRFFAPVSVLTLQIPRARLGLNDHDTRRAGEHVMASATPATVVLRHFLLGVLAAGGFLKDDNESIVDTAVTLLSMSLRSDADENDISPSDEVLWYTVGSFLREHMRDAALSLDDVARYHRVSRRRLEVAFARHDQSPAAYLRTQRIRRAAGILMHSQPTLTVSEVAFDVGFNDITTFIRAFRRELGATPHEWRLSRK